MEKYKKPQLDVCTLNAAESMLTGSDPLQINNKMGNGNQRSKHFDVIEMIDEESEEGEETLLD